MAQQLKEQNHKSDDQQRLINQMVEHMSQLGHGRGNQFSHALDSAINGDPENRKFTCRNTFHVNPKVEFPAFDGANPRGWIKKCTRYFTLCRILDDQTVDLTSMYL